MVSETASQIVEITANLPNTTDVPVLLKYGCVNVLAVHGVFKIWLDDEVAKVNLPVVLAKRRQPKRRAEVEVTYARLDSDDGTSGNMTTQSQVAEHLVFVVGVRVAASVMGVHAQVMSETVGEEGSACAGVENLFGVSLENAEGKKSINGNLVSMEVQVVPEHAALDEFCTFLLHSQDNIVDVSGFLGEFASQRKGSCLKVTYVSPLEPERRVCQLSWPRALQYLRHNCSTRNQHQSANFACR